MVALLMYLKHLSWIYCIYLWLATLAAVNAQEVLQPTSEKLQIVNEDTEGNTTYPVAVPKTRSDFLQYYHQITLDQNTLSRKVRLSENNTVITYTYLEVQPYPDHPDRFDDPPQVLCRESVRGRSYWEIEWSDGAVHISVSYQNISRKGEGYECVFGFNEHSYSLFCSPDRYSFIHNSTVTDLPKVSSHRIGVYVDPSAGTLSFYSVSGETMSLIHTVQTTFTQPLYPGFSVLLGSMKLLMNGE